MLRPVVAFVFAAQFVTRPVFASPSVGDASRAAAESEIRRTGGFGSRARGYAILVAAMVVSAAATSYLSSKLPANAQFLSYFVTQVSTLGVYVFGAPIWEPLASDFRKLAFGVDATAASPDDVLETQWRRTQRAYSLNEQMSRNVITSFLVSAKLNFYEARRAVRSGDPVFAAEQIAEAAVRLRLHFADIAPDDESVAMAVRSSFTSHVRVDADFRAAVVAAVRRVDPSVTDVDLIYGGVLGAWLG